MREKGSDTTCVRILGGAWDGTTGVVTAREAGRLFIRLDDGTEIEVETASGVGVEPVVPRELGS